jgi:hypothetical protein
MDKIAGKPSSDPNQQKLRDAKKVWNKEVSALIDNIIQFKQLINGKENKFHGERSTIKEPIPADPVSILSTLISEFQDIAQKGNAIVAQQLEYARTRRKKQPKQIGISPPKTDLSAQLTAAMDEQEIIVLSSNMGTRFFKRILNTGLGLAWKSRERKYRMSLLQAATDLYKDINKLQAAIVSSSAESIFISSKTLSKIIDNWEFFKSGIGTYKDSIGIKDQIKENKKETKNEKKKETLSKNDPEIEEIGQDYKKYAFNFSDLDIRDLLKAIAKYSLAKTKEEKEEAKNDIKNQYNDAIIRLNQKLGTSGKTFQEIWETKNAEAGVSSHELEKIAQRALKKWLGKIRHQLSATDKTSAYRLDIYKSCQKAKDAINNIMNSLERGMEIAELEKYAAQIDAEVRAIQYLILELEETLSGKGFDKPFLSLLEKGRITNQPTNLDKKQKELLQRRIENERLRTLIDLYRGNK